MNFKEATAAKNDSINLTVDVLYDRVLIVPYHITKKLYNYCGESASKNVSRNVTVEEYNWIVLVLETKKWI